MRAELTFTEDLLERKIIAENLTKIIETKNDLHVLAINGGWGTGKTTFINKWNHMLLEDGYEKQHLFETIHLNAWENDYIDDPFLLIAYELRRKINQLSDKSCQTKKELASEIRAAGAGVVNMMTPDKIKTFQEGYQRFKNKSLDFETIETMKALKAELKDDLAKFQMELDKKIIIFIDELDRCRPPFAVELLEVIKHLFSVEGFVFVIAVDKIQLTHAIKTLYGEGMDGDGYLRRFFDLEYNLSSQKNVLIYFEQKALSLRQLSPQYGYLFEFLEKIIIFEGYSLRDVDKLCSYLEILLHQIRVRQANDRDTYSLVVSYLYAYFINLRFKHEDKYEKVVLLKYPMEERGINSLINYKVEQFNFDFGKYCNSSRIYHDETSKKVLSNVLYLYLELYRKVQSDSAYYHKTQEEMSYFTVGLKRTESEYYTDCKLDLLDVLKSENILGNMEFLSDFNL